MCDYTRTHQRDLAANPATAFPQSVAGFFRLLPAIHGAVEAVERLRDEFDVYVLTAPSTRNPHCYTEKRLWIEDHFGYDFTTKLIISPNKGLLKGDFLIDDKSKGRGQDQFEGTLIQFGTGDFPDWSAVLKYFEKLCCV